MAGEKAGAWPRARIALAGDPGSILSSYTVAHNSSTSVPGDPLPSFDLQAHM